MINNDDDGGRLPNKFVPGVSYPISLCPVTLRTVASLGWGTPGAATKGVTSLFFPDDVFAHRYHYRFLLVSLGCYPLPPRGCHPTCAFLSVRPRFSIILCKFAHHFFSFGCPLEGVTRDGPPP